MHNILIIDLAFIVVHLVFTSIHPIGTFRAFKGIF